MEEDVEEMFRNGDYGVSSFYDVATATKKMKGTTQIAISLLRSSFPLIILVLLTLVQVEKSSKELEMPEEFTKSPHKLTEPSIEKVKKEQLAQHTACDCMSRAPK